MTTTTASIAPADATDRIHAYFRLCEDIAKLLAYLIVASYAAVQALREQFDDITGRRPIDHSTKAALPRIEILYPVQQDVSPVRAAALSTVPVKELRQQARALRAAGRWCSDIPPHMANRGLLIQQLLAWE